MRSRLCLSILQSNYFWSGLSIGNHILSALSPVVSLLKVEDLDLAQLSVNLCAIAKFSIGGIYKTKITGKDIAKVSRGGI